MRLARNPPLRRLALAGGELWRLRIDTGAGVLLSNLVAFFIILTTAATLHARGITHIETAAGAAEALRPLAGDFAFGLFAVGIIGAGLLAIPVLAGSAAYAVSELFEAGFSLETSFRRAPWLYAIIIFAVLCGAALDFAGVKAIDLLIWNAFFNGLIAPPFLIAMMIIASSEEAMGAHVSPPWLRALGWMAAVAMTLAVVMLGFSMIR